MPMKLLLYIEDNHKNIKDLSYKKTNYQYSNKPFEGISFTEGLMILEYNKLCLLAGKSEYEIKPIDYRKMSFEERALVFSKKRVVNSKKPYREISLQLHPDKNPDNKDIADAMVSLNFLVGIGGDDSASIRRFMEMNISSLLYGIEKEEAIFNEYSSEEVQEHVKKNKEKYYEEMKKDLQEIERSLESTPFEFGSFIGGGIFGRKVASFLSNLGNFFKNPNLVVEKVNSKYKALKFLFLDAVPLAYSCYQLKKAFDDLKFIKSKRKLYHFVGGAAVGAFDRVGTGIISSGVKPFVDLCDETFSSPAITARKHKI